MTGDLSEGGTREGYEFMREGLRKLPRPVYIVPGNHDKRDFFRNVYRGNSRKRISNLISAIQSMNIQFE